MTISLMSKKMRHGANVKSMSIGCLLLFVSALSPMAYSQASELLGLAKDGVDAVANDANVVKLSIWLTIGAMSYSGWITWILIGQVKEMVRTVDRLAMAMSKKPCLMDTQIERFEKESSHRRHQEDS